MQHQVQAFHRWQISGKVVQLFPAKGPLAASALPPKLLMQHPWIDDHGDCGLGVLFIYSNVFEFEDVRFLFFFFFFFKTPFLPRFEHGMICSTTATPVEEKLHKSDHMRSWARKRNDPVWSTVIGVPCHFKSASTKEFATSSRMHHACDQVKLMRNCTRPPLPAKDGKHMY